MNWPRRNDCRIQGKVRVGTSTKILLCGLESRRIIVIKHEDLDEVAAIGMKEAKVRAVINAASSMTGRYPAKGAEVCLNAGIPIFGNRRRRFRAFSGR